MPRFTVKYVPEALEEIKQPLIIITIFLAGLATDLNKIFLKLLKPPNLILLTILLDMMMYVLL